MKRFGTTQKILAAVLVGNLVLAGAYYYVFSRIGAENQNIAAREDSIMAETQKSGDLAATKGAVAESAAARAALDSHFIGPDGVVPFLNFVQSLGSARNLVLKINSVGIEPLATTSDAIETLALDIEATGTWSNIYRFLALAELMPYGAFIEQGNLNVQGDTSAKARTANAEGQWKLTMNLKVLKLKAQP